MRESAGDASLTTGVCSSECTEKGWIWKVAQTCNGTLLQQHGQETKESPGSSCPHWPAVRSAPQQDRRRKPTPKSCLSLCVVVHAHLPTHLTREESCGVELYLCGLSQQLNTDTVSREQQILTPPSFSSALWRFQLVCNFIIANESDRKRHWKPTYPFPVLLVLLRG